MSRLTKLKIQIEFEELMKMSQKNQELTRILEIGENAWNTTEVYARLLKITQEKRIEPRIMYSYRSV